MEQEPLTGESVMTFGMHKGVKIKLLPEVYFIKFYRLNRYKEDEKIKRVIRYIESSGMLPENPKKQIEKAPEKKIDISYRETDKFGRLVCNLTGKYIFITEKEAKFEIRRIAKLQQKNKKPVRSYECEKCGGWHLTSISFEENKKFKKKPKKIKHKMAVIREVFMIAEFDNHGVLKLKEGEYSTYSEAVRAIEMFPNGNYQIQKVHVKK